MDDTVKYLIHAAITADGVVERSDVVGAIFGQTEGLLGDELDLRDLQQSSKVGRIDVQIQSQNGQSYGEITIASSLDKVETSILAASLETISRVGPCRSTVEVTEIEDVRAAKRRDVVERAKELLADSFDDSIMTSREILDEVRESVRVEDITDYAGVPAGPRVDTSDAIIVVEGRADVLTLLRYGVKNAVAVEGTNVPEEIAELTQERTVTAFLDGDRGGELILRELTQVGDVDYVAFAPPGRSVEDLARHEVMSALRNKVPYDTLADRQDVRQAVAATDGSARPAPESDTHPRTESPGATDAPAAPTPEGDLDPAANGTADAAVGESVEPTANGDATRVASTSDFRDATALDPDAAADGADASADEPAGNADAGDADAVDVDADQPESMSDEGSGSLNVHVGDVIRARTSLVRLLDADLASITDVSAGDAFDAIANAQSAPRTVVLDGRLDQRVLDVAAQRGVEQIVARSTGEFVKRPVGVRVLTADQFSAE
jgi:DNA primase